MAWFIPALTAKTVPAAAFAVASSKPTKTTR